MLILWLQKKVWQQIFFHPSLLLLFLDPGSGMSKNQDPGSGINIQDPQHWLEETQSESRLYMTSDGKTGNGETCCSTVLYLTTRPLGTRVSVKFIVAEPEP